MKKRRGCGVKRIAISVLALVLIVSVSGCVAKSEHDKVLQDKASIERECTKLTQENKGLKSQVSTLRKVKEDLTKLTQENRRLKNESSALQKEKEALAQQLKQVTEKVKDLNSQLSKVKAASEVLQQ